MLGHRTMTAQDYMSILKKRWWMIMLPAVILTIAGYVITHLVPPIYKSQTLVLIEQQKVPEHLVEPNAGQQAAEQPRLSGAAGRGCFGSRFHHLSPHAACSSFPGQGRSGCRRSFSK